MSQVGVGGTVPVQGSPDPALLLRSCPPAPMCPAGHRAAAGALSWLISGFQPWHFCKFSLDPKETGSPSHGAASGHQAWSQPSTLSHVIPTNVSVHKIPTNVSIHKPCNSWVCNSF